MDYSWNMIKDFFKEAARNAFFPYPFSIIGKTSDNLTKRTVFKLKAKKSTAQLHKSPQEIIHSDYYFSGLSVEDRKSVEQQYLIELAQPKAFIEEFPIVSNHNNEFIFKILLLEERKLICGSASFFFVAKKDILSWLNHKDLIAITKAYCMENIKTLPVEFGEADLNLNKPLNHNIRYIK